MANDASWVRPVNLHRKMMHEAYLHYVPYIDILRSVSVIGIMHGCRSCESFVTILYSQQLSIVT